jgi:hypothetical protein
VKNEILPLSCTTKVTGKKTKLHIPSSEDKKEYIS